MRILPEYCFCFDTKARVPVKLTVECIRVEDASKWELYENKKDYIKYKSDINVHAEYSSVESFLTNYDFQKQDEKEALANIEHAKINPFGEPWAIQERIIKQNSPYSQFATHTVKSFIYKSNDDMRQEQLVIQFIKRFNEVLSEANMPLRITEYEILTTSNSSGLIEYIPNSASIDGIKKQLPVGWNLNTFFRDFFDSNFDYAQKNFIESLAASSIMCYLLNIKDRHNGNILLDITGRIIHIDFGFILGLAPGGISFEASYFKLTQEYIDMMDGADSELFSYFKNLIYLGLSELRNHVDNFVKMAEILGKGCSLPCFTKDMDYTLSQFRERFLFGKTTDELRVAVDLIIENSINSFWTNQYDNYQKLTNGILQ